jgi:putative flippase GtrA
MSRGAFSGALGRMVRSVGVGVATTALTNTILVTLTFGFGVRAGLSNVIGTLCGIGPSYAWNRRYAWRLSAPSSWRRQVIPFWVLSIVGLVASTAAVAAIARAGAAWPAGVRAIALPAANLSMFASLWLVQFVVLDRVLFRRRADARDTRRGTDGAVPARPSRASAFPCTTACDPIATEVAS